MKSKRKKKIYLQHQRFRRQGLNLWVGKIPWRRAWQPTPVFLPGESHVWRSLPGSSLQSHKESDPIEVTEHTHTLAIYLVQIQGNDHEDAHRIHRNEWNRMKTST